MRQSMDIERAENAHIDVKIVKELEKSDDENKQKIPGKYKSLVKSVPTMIRNNGLGQTVAFLMSKKKDEGKECEHRLLISHIRKWLKKLGIYTIENDAELIKQIVENDSDKYIRAQEEAILYANWLAKFATAFIEEEGEEE